MSRVELAKIKSLTFYKDEETTYRRTSPLPQLKCIGKPCRLYQPDVVRCTNAGGGGVDIDWRCEADLPEALRFGRVEVSCEGYSGAGDPFILKGSCALEYRLVQVPDALRPGNADSNHRAWKAPDMDIASTLFWMLWIGILIFIVYSFLKSCLDTDDDGRRRVHRGGNNRPGGGGGGGGWNNWFPGANDTPDAPPPPYTKNAPAAVGQGAGGWRPGFWTGAAVGGLANHFLNRAPRPAQPQPYGWERSPFGGARDEPVRRRPAPRFDDDRGEGSSNLGAMRSSVGIGGTNVR